MLLDQLQRNNTLLSLTIQSMNVTLGALLAKVASLEASYSNIKDVCKTTAGRRLETNTQPCGDSVIYTPSNGDNNGHNEIDTSSNEDNNSHNETTGNPESIDNTSSSTTKNVAGRWRNRGILIIKT